MGLDQSGVLTVGTLVPKEGGHTLLHSTLLVSPPWSRKPPLFVGSPMLMALGQHHMVNKANICWVAANPTSGHPAHASNHRYRTAGLSQGRCSAPQAADA